jgi:hypothetical protein
MRRICTCSEPQVWGKWTEKTQRGRCKVCANGLLMLRAGSGIFGASLSTTKSVWNQVHRSCTLKGGRWSSKWATELWLRRATSPQSTTAIFTRHRCYCHYCTLADVLGPHHQLNKESHVTQNEPDNAMTFAPRLHESERMLILRPSNRRKGLPKMKKYRVFVLSRSVRSHHPSPPLFPQYIV